MRFALLAVLLVAALAGCAFTFQERPKPTAACSNGRGLAAIDGFTTLAALALTAYAGAHKEFPLRVVAIPVGAAGVLGFGASAILGRGWSERCRHRGG